ncbi:MAG: serpin family protein [Deltaproteobacteria bacterium]|nr:serpin family protein [Deltaproteobacteria bacterium]
MLSALLFLVCASRPASGVPAPPADVAPALPEAVAEGTAAPAAPPAPEAVRGLAAGLNGFACGLWRELSAGSGAPGNLFLSPLSAAEALGMVLEGAEGGTADEIAGALGLPVRGEALPATWAGLREGLRRAGGGEGGVFRAAASLWPATGFPLRRGFLDGLGRGFGPSAFPVDYAGDGAAAREAINAWALDATGGLITDLLPEPLPPETALVLANAVYFKGRWGAPFDPGLTAEGDFRAPGGRVVRARYMTRTGRYGYVADGPGQILELPFAGGSFVMDVLLPGEGEGALAALEGALAGDTLAARLSSLAAREVQVSLPRFRLGWGSASLKDALAALGVRDLFTGRADLSGMAEGGGLLVSDVFHKAFVEVDEEGAEAAAATGAGVSVTSIGPPPVRFAADRPFLFLIRDTGTGAVVFAGRLADPSAE